MRVRVTDRNQSADDYWKIYIAQDIDTTQEYDVRVTTFDKGDVKSMNRLKQEISLWVAAWT